MATVTRMTADQYYAIAVEGDRNQLVEGQIVVNEALALSLPSPPRGPGPGRTAAG